MKKHVLRLAYYLTHYIQIQLFITLMSLPVLMWWGLPFSLMSFVGNLIFSPIIVAFLTLSSLIFMTELASIPNYYLVWSLEKVTTVMTTLLSYGSKNWLVAFPKLNSVFLIAQPSHIHATSSLLIIRLMEQLYYMMREHLIQK